LSSDWSGELNVYLGDQFTSELSKYLKEDAGGYQEKFMFENFEHLAYYVERGMSSNVGRNTYIEGSDHISKVLVKDFFPPPALPTPDQVSSNQTKTFESQFLSRTVEE